MSCPPPRTWGTSPGTARCRPSASPATGRRVPARTTRTWSACCWAAASAAACSPTCSTASTPPSPPQGYHPLVLDTYAETYSKAAEKEAEGLHYARENGFAGIVLWHEGGSANVSLIQEVRDEMPVVAIDRRVPGVELDYVGTDNFRGAYDATRHLIALGHTRIAHLTRLETTAAAGAPAGLPARAGRRRPGPQPAPHPARPGQRAPARPGMVRQVFTGPDAPPPFF